MIETILVWAYLALSTAIVASGIHRDLAQERKVRNNV